MATLYRPRRKSRAISLTPLVDVVFILLVFFMLASSFLDWRSIEMKLPAPGMSGVGSTRVLVVGIEHGNAVILAGQPVDDGDLAEKLRRRLARNPAQALLIRVAETVPLQRAIQVLEVVEAAGGRDVALSRGGARAP